ncbi:MAG: hypothetical protein Q9O62_06960 [Ardenticatenia bacterium]|nr:hypothetical protein [Ardenticatenia bacterium]
MDGGRDILVENNRAHHCNVGVEITPANMRGAANVIVHQASSPRTPRLASP